MTRNRTQQARTILKLYIKHPHSQMDGQKTTSYTSRVVVDTIALIDTRAYMNYVQEGLILTQYYEKTIEKLYSANHSRLK